FRRQRLAAALVRACAEGAALRANLCGARAARRVSAIHVRSALPDRSRKPRATQAEAQAARLGGAEHSARVRLPLPARVASNLGTCAPIASDAVSPGDSIPKSCATRGTPGSACA